MSIFLGSPTMSLPFAAHISTNILRVSVFEEIPGISKELPTIEENILHEACHVVTLGTGDANHDLSRSIEDAIHLLSLEASRNNELQTLAVEIVIMCRYGLLESRDDFLFRVLKEQWFTTGFTARQYFLSIPKARNIIRSIEVMPLTQELADQVLRKLEDWSRRWPA